MGKFMKNCGIAALVMVLVGMILALVAGAIQGPVALENIVSSATNGRVHISLVDWDEWGIEVEEAAERVEENMDHLEDVIENGLEQNDDTGSRDYGKTGDIETDLIFDRTAEVQSGDIATTDLGTGIRKMDIQAGGCEFLLLESEDEHFYIEADDADKFQAFVRNDTLHVRVSKTYRLSQSTVNCKVRLYVPKDTYFQELDLDLGAGKMEGDELRADEISLETGAGSMYFVYLDAKEIDISIGAGMVEIVELATDSLDVEVGMGHLVSRGDVRKSADIECAMGNVELTLDGNQDDFNYSLDCAMGNIVLDNDSYGGLAEEKRIQNGASKEMDIECSMGNVTILF